MHRQHSDIDFQMIEVNVRLAAVHGEAHFVTAWINVCGRPLECKHVVRTVQGLWSGTVVCPASRLRRFICRGPVWRCEDRVHIVYASLKALRSVPGFPDPVSMTVCPYVILRPAHIPPDSIRSPAAQTTGAGSR